MIFTELPLKGAFRVDPERIGDERGHFARMFCADEFAAHGLCTSWFQTNRSFTKKAGTTRGLHFQRPPAVEAKLIRCSRGAVFDVIVDLRAGSPKFGQWTALELSEANATAVYAPQGFAHGFQTLTDSVEMSYMHSARYSPDHEGGVLLDDPELGISWPMKPSNQSARDLAFPPLSSVEPIKP
ncbi:dTDP-4-dehydrorhamnose 3,5-epimerase [Rhodophyticola porphyridii]|uniref:dTDP-4-dehydrorhamnose 3,5-epimerase n=1 Tax=Rhodophyticola porphyridii TaxID=1852017 RepID=A0A3L9XVM6_9RHOB|nr:dTDP-4-dehydrorhamnose 3,5-epimerase [Rhodophyticola porphyridii]RMA40664.1 dTDP-4-dehydrorhamnose 3,5-epimerase [Rhodophyticola porphyridii]